MAVVIHRSIRLISLTALVLLAGCLAQTEQSPDPFVEDFGIAYIKRAWPAMDESDAREQLGFEPGADLYYRDLASPSAAEHNVTGRLTGGMGDVRDLEPSFDGSRLVFSMQLPDPDPTDDIEPTWNIWEYDIAADTLRRVIGSDITAEAGHDVAPAYLPDGRIVFSSTRQRTAKATLLDEGKPQYAGLTEDRREPALVLHVMNADGSEIRQVSFNQSHDLDPSVTQDGKVVFTRWNNMGGVNRMHLYRMAPDGTELELLYGAKSHDTGSDDSRIEFLQPREMPDGRLLSILRPFSGTDRGGDLALIDSDNYVENAQPTAVNSGVLSGPAQTPATINQVMTEPGISPGGRFAAAWPLWDGTDRLLVSWSQCRLLEAARIVPCTPDRLADPNAQPAPPVYGIYMYDREQQTQLPIVKPEEGVMYTEVVAARPRTLPDIIFDKAGGIDLDQQLVDEGVGVLDIRSVYDFDGGFNPLGGSRGSIEALADPAQTTADERPARFLRIVKAVSIPERDVLRVPGTAFGRSAGQLMREIVGYTPIQPDGSVRVKVPANVPIALSVLDGQGRRLTARHRGWLQLRPGEQLTCNGCHAPSSELSHGRADAFQPVHTGAATTGLPYPNTDPALFANMGETMAEVLTRIDPSALQPSVDVLFDDVWTDEAAAGRAKDASFAWRYADLDPAMPAPVSAQCQQAWTPLCRIVINYETHIHPLWGRDRNADTCTNCHNTVDAMGNLQVPKAQLDLSDGPSDQQAAHFKSYRELLFGDNEQEIVNGALQDRLVQATDGAGNPLFERDADGNLILDGNGQPIPIMVTVPVAPAMSVAGARASSRFFSLFDPGGSHEGRLEAAELRLIAEWLDIGGQYYNNPFDAPPP